MTTPSVRPWVRPVVLAAVTLLVLLTVVIVLVSRDPGARAGNPGPGSTTSATSATSATGSATTSASAASVTPGTSGSPSPTGKPGRPTGQSTAAATAGSGGSSSSRAASTTSSQPGQGIPAACRNDHGPFRPAQLVLARLEVAVPVLALSLAADGTFPVPPFDGGVDPRWSAAWWQDGAAPGDGEGVVHLDVHTYGEGAALGNLFGGSARVGDLIMVLDASGTVGACYRVSAIPTWTVAEVTASLGTVSRLTGKPQLAVEFCWDTAEHWGDRKWRLRRYLIADAV